MKTFKVSEIMQPLHNRVMQVGSPEDTEYLKQRVPVFPELEDRIQATDWHDQLLDANIATMRNEEPDVTPEETNAMMQGCKEIAEQYNGREKWLLTARFMSSKLMKFGMGFDFSVQGMIEGTRIEWCYSKKLCDEIEREMLKGLQASPEYKAFKMN